MTDAPASTLSMGNRPLKICLIARNAYPVVVPTASGVFGGMETGAWEFARSLARLSDTSVSLVIEHRDAPPRSQFAGVTVASGTSWVDIYREDWVNFRQDIHEGKRLPFSQYLQRGFQAAALAITRPLRVRHDREWRTPWPVLVQLDADVYAPTGVNVTTARVVQTAKSLRRPVALLLMSDTDLNPEFLNNPDYRDQNGVTSEIARSILTEVDVILAQTERQRMLLRQIWNRDSHLVTNALDIPCWDAAARNPLPATLSLPPSPFALWIGRADRFHKRPLEMLAAVRVLPQISFLMILNPRDADVQQEIQNANLPNLTVIERVPFESMAALMSRSHLLVSTGNPEFEGLPNVLLQAAALKLPIVSLEAGAEWLRDSGAGYCANGDRTAFIATIERGMSPTDVTEFQRYGEAGRHYVKREHDEAVVSRRFVESLRTVLTKPSPSVT